MSAMALLTPAGTTAADGVVALDHGGRPGFWVPEALFLEMERRYEDHFLLEGKLRVREEELRLRGKELDLRIKTASIAERRAALAWSRYEEERAAHAQTRKDGAEAIRELRTAAIVGAWERLGLVVLGAGVAIGIAYAVRPAQTLTP